MKKKAPKTYHTIKTPVYSILQDWCDNHIAWGYEITESSASEGTIELYSKKKGLRVEECVYYSATAEKIGEVT